MNPIRRFRDELPLWRLSAWQLLAIGVLAVWPWLILALFPGQEILAYGPVFIFLPLGYLIGGLMTSLTPQATEFTYGLGISLTIFAGAYLLIVSWRQRRLKKAKLEA